MRAGRGGWAGDTGMGGLQEWVWTWCEARCEQIRTRGWVACRSTLARFVTSGCGSPDPNRRTARALDRRAQVRQSTNAKLEEVRRRMGLNPAEADLFLKV